ncbi:hypothetical protein QT970_25065 [Microcoleus sp. herbarium8]
MDALFFARYQEEPGNAGAEEEPQEPGNAGAEEKPPFTSALTG